MDHPSKRSKLEAAPQFSSPEEEEEALRYAKMSRAAEAKHSAKAELKIAPEPQVSAKPTFMTKAERQVRTNTAR